MSQVEDPTFGSILRRGLPGFLREGFLPLGFFYAGQRAAGLVGGMAAAALASLLVYALERRAGRDGLLVRLSLVFVATQTVIGLVSQSTVAYLAAPVLANGAWGLAFLGSVAVGRPLAGALACAWYPFPPAVRDGARFRRTFGIESMVWGAYLLARSGLRLTLLLKGGSVGAFIVLSFVTGTPAALGLMAWSIWFARRRFLEPDPPQVLGKAARRRWRVSDSGVSSGSTRSRRDSKAGGSETRSPRSSSGSSEVKPGPMVARSNSTPLGSRK